MLLNVQKIRVWGCRRERLDCCARVQLKARAQNRLLLSRTGFQNMFSEHARQVPPPFSVDARDGGDGEGACMCTALFCTEDPLPLF